MSNVVRAPKPVKKKAFNENKENMKSQRVLKSSLTSGNKQGYPDKFYQLMCSKEEVAKSNIDAKNIPRLRENILISKFDNTFILPDDKEFEEDLSDFVKFKSNIDKEVKDSEAKEEILSILDNPRMDLRSSMLTLRPSNPFTKNLIKNENVLNINVDFSVNRTSNLHLKSSLHVNRNNSNFS